MEKKRITFNLVLMLLVLFMGIGALNAQITITRDWDTGAFAGEPGWQIINTATNAVVDCEATGGAIPNAAPVNINVPAGTYEVRGFDSFGDGWNGNGSTTGRLRILQSGVVIFTTFGPPNAGFFPGGNTCPGPSPVNGISSTVLGTFCVQNPCTLTCPAPITVTPDPGACEATVFYEVTTDCTCPVEYSIEPGSSFFPGTTTTVDVTSGGNSCSFTVTVTPDVEEPVVTCPADMIINLDPGLCSADVN